MPSRWEMPPVYLQSGNPETESTPTLHAPGQLGMRFTMTVTQRQGPGTDTDPAGRSKRYQLVKTDSTMAVAPYNGAVAWWADKAGYVVTTSASKTARGQIAGVFRRAWDAAGDYMCVQTEGPGYVKLVDGDVAATVGGDAIIPSATDSKANRVAAGTAPTYPTLGFAHAPTTKNAIAALVLVDLDVPETT